MEPSQRNPNHRARPLSDRGDVRSVRGCGLGQAAGSSSPTGDATDEPGVHPPISSRGCPCPPRCHSETVAGAWPDFDIQIQGRAIDPCYGNRSPLQIGVSTPSRTLSYHP